MCMFLKSSTCLSLSFGNWVGVFILGKCEVSSALSIKRKIVAVIYIVLPRAYIPLKTKVGRLHAAVPALRSCFISGKTSKLFSALALSPLTGPEGEVGWACDSLFHQKLSWVWLFSSTAWRPKYLVESLLQIDRLKVSCESQKSTSPQGAVCGSSHFTLQFRHNQWPNQRTV